MALTVEDGTGLAAADSYISRANADTYWTNHGAPTTWSGASTDARDAALRYATQWLDARYEWIGERLVTTQALAWPRDVDYDLEDRDISTQPPQAIKDALCEAALAHIGGSLSDPVERGGAIAAATIGPLSVSYSGGAPSGRTFRYIDGLVRGLALASASAPRAVLG